MKSGPVSEGNKKSKSNIGLKIEKLLELHDVKLSRIASATGLTSEAIRQIINGTIKNPGIETLSRIADAFSITLFDLLETRDVTSHINKKRIKIIDIFDLYRNKIDDLINKSIESTEILYIDTNAFNSDFFAIAVNSSLAEKLTNCGMPMLNQGDLLIFVKNGDYSTNSIILARCNDEALILGIILEVEDENVWVKSVDISQKQVVIKIKKQEITGIVHNVQFIK